MCFDTQPITSHFLLLCQSFFLPFCYQCKFPFGFCASVNHCCLYRLTHFFFFTAQLPEGTLLSPGCGLCQAPTGPPRTVGHGPSYASHPGPLTGGARRSLPPIKCLWHLSTVAKVQPTPVVGVARGNPRYDNPPGRLICVTARWRDKPRIKYLALQTKGGRHARGKKETDQYHLHSCQDNIMGRLCDQIIPSLTAPPLRQTSRTYLYASRHHFFFADGGSGRGGADGLIVTPGVIRSEVDSQGVS